jgi:transposase
MSNFFDGPDPIDDGALIQIRFRDLVPENHPVRYIDMFINGIDVKLFEGRYKVGRGCKGRAPKNIHLMLKVILYAIYLRIYSARKIDYATGHFADFWFFTHGERISHDKISDFINVHGDDIQPIFLATIGLASKNDLLDFSALYEDGFKVKADASMKRSRTLEGLSKEEKKLSANLDVVLAKLQLPEVEETVIEEHKKTQRAIEKIALLREELQRRISERSEGKPPSRIKDIEKKVQINLTDCDAEIMKQKDWSNAVSYLKETAIDSKADIVIGSVISGHDNENILSLPLVLQANQNCKDAGCDRTYVTAVADSGFTTAKNCADFEQHQIILIGPSQNYEHSVRIRESQDITFRYNQEENSLMCSEGKILPCERSYYSKDEEATFNVFSNPEACAQCTRLKNCTKSKDGYRTVKLNEFYGAQQRVLARYLSENGQKLYKNRSHSAETYQGDLKQNGKFLRFLRRGIKKVKVDSVIHDIVWNLRRIFNSKGQAIVWNI